MRILVLCLLIAGCAKGGGDSAANGKPVPNPVTSVQTTVSASRLSNGTTNDGVLTITKTGTLTIPLPSEFIITANMTDLWHITTTVSGVNKVCDYAHQAGAGFITTSGGCTTLNSYFSVNAGDTVTISITTPVASTAAANVTLTNKY